MPDNPIDFHLTPWSEVEGKTWESLLLGNGFSMNIWPKFEYESLFDVAKLDDIGSPLDVRSIALFDDIQSNNFEDVLKILFHAHLVDKQLNSPQKYQIDALYKTTKNALAAAVNYSHVPSGFNALIEINSAFQDFTNIFTTNYDLIPYWAIMVDLWRFKDFFWGNDCIFDPSNVGLPADSCAIFYLHGAIHLVELPDGRTKKLTGNGVTTLVDLFDLDHPEYIPLFVSEGASDRKLSRIKRNDYLRFSFEKLQPLNGNLLVIGHSLHKDYDQHLVNALHDGQVDTIAIGIWPHQPPAQILTFKARILKEFKGKRIDFFDSTTHPLGRPGLRHEA